MKKNNLLVLSLIIFLVSINGALAGSQLGVSLSSQNPDPAVAGEIVELRFSVVNRDTSFSDYTMIELVPAYPFKSVFGEEYTQEVGVLTGYQTGDEATILKYTVKIDKDAVAGSYPLTLRIYNDDGSYYLEKEIYIDIESQDNAEIIYIDTTEIEPGEQKEIEFTIYNVGSTPLRDMSFSWENSDEAVLPVGSGNTRYIKYLDVGESYKIIYNIIADSEADSGLYKLDLFLTYDNSLTGITENISTNAGIYIGGGTSFEVAFSEVDESEYSFTVANVGSNDANSVSVVIPSQDDWSSVGANTELIGNLNKGDYTIASFDLQNTGRSGIIDVNIVYTDTKGVRKTIEKEVSLGGSVVTNNTEGNLQKTSSGGQSGMRAMGGGLTQIMTTMKWVGAGILLLIVGIVGYKVYRKKKPKKKKK